MFRKRTQSPIIDLMIRIGGLLALLAVLVVLVDPAWCADGCTDTAGLAPSEAGAPCAICQRSITPVASIAVPVRVVEVPAFPTQQVVPLPSGWHPRLERPPRLS